MKKILLLITSFCTLSVAYSQDSTSITTTNVKDDYINSGTLFVKLFANDFQTEYGVSGSSLKIYCLTETCLKYRIWVLALA